MSSLKSRKRTERITNALCFIALIFLTCLCMLPIWWIFRSSLMSNAELFKWPPAFFPPRWLFSNYANTLEYFKFWTYLKNTMIIIVPSVIFGTITATMCGYAFARLRFRLRNFLFTLCVGSMLLPTMVTLIPLYIMWTKFFNMSNTFWPLILPYLCGGGAFNIFLIRQFVRSIPRELDEAATIDGAGYFRILLNVIVPSIKSAMIVVAMFLFIQIWNDLLQQMIYINTEEWYPLQLRLRELLIASQMLASMEATEDVMYAAYMQRVADLIKYGMIVISTLPVMILYPILQKYFVQGVMIGSLKG